MYSDYTPLRSIAIALGNRGDERAAGFLRELSGSKCREVAEAGLVRLGVVALDGTKIGADASADANRTLDELTAETANPPSRRPTTSSPR